MPSLLVVAHAPSENTRALREAVVEGASRPEIDGVHLRVLAPLDAGPADVLGAGGLIIGSTENFGAMCGLIKDFFERIYHPCLETTQGLPFCFYVRAGNDGAGTRVGIERITTGLRWRLVQPPLVLAGPFVPAFRAQCAELGQTMAAGLSAGIY